MPDSLTPTVAPELAPINDHTRRFFIDGSWVDPVSPATLDVINPATEKPVATIALGGQDDVDAAVAAARRAFESYSQTGKDERIALMERVIEVYKAHMNEIAALVRLEMGAPTALAEGAQAPAGLGHLMATLEALKSEDFEETIGSTSVVYEPVGVCGFITPWNWPLNQIVAKGRAPRWPPAARWSSSPRRSLR